MATPEGLIVRRLDRRLMEEVVGELIELDRPACAAGDLETWGPEHFTADLPDKWQLSMLARLSGRAVGYRIVSGAGKLPSMAHGHRLVVDPAHRRRGVATALVTRTELLAQERGFPGVTGLIDPANLRSQAFFCSIGYRRERSLSGGDRLWVRRFSGR